MNNMYVLESMLIIVSMDLPRPVRATSLLGLLIYGYMISSSGFE